MSAAGINHLQVVLTALLPKDGAARSVAVLADLAGCSADQVRGELSGEGVDRRIRFDAASDSFSLQREAS